MVSLRDAGGGANQRIARYPSTSAAAAAAADTTAHGHRADDMIPAGAGHRVHAPHTPVGPEPWLSRASSMHQHAAVQYAAAYTHTAGAAHAGPPAGGCSQASTAAATQPAAVSRPPGMAARLSHLRVNVAPTVSVPPPALSPSGLLSGAGPPSATGSSCRSSRDFPLRASRDFSLLRASHSPLPSPTTSGGHTQQGAPASGGLDSPYEGGASTPPWSPRFDAVAAHMAAAASKTAPMAPSIVAVHSVRLQAPSFCRPRNTPSPGPRLLSAFPESPAPAPAPAARAPCYQRQSSCRSLRPASQLATPMPAQRASSLSSHNWFQPETTVELSPHSATAELAPAWDERELHGPKHGTRALAAEQAQQSAALFAAHAARRQAPEAGAEPAGAPGGRPSSGRRSGAPDATHVASYTPSTAEAVSTSAARVTTGASGRAARSLLPGQQQQQQQQQQPGASAHASHRQPPPQQRASVGVSNPAYSPHPAQPHAPPASSSSSSGAFTAAPGALVSGQFGGGSPSSARTRPAAPASKFHPTKVYTSETTDRVLVARTAV